MNTIFFFSHSTQPKWYATFAESFCEHLPDCRIVLFVHGETDRQYASQFSQFHEIIDLTRGFKFNKELRCSESVFSQELLELERQLNQSFFWEDMTVDRYIRIKNCTSFSVQYLNHAFQCLYQQYKKYNPICGFGESTMAIYRLAHHLFDRDHRLFLTPMYTRYFNRFYLETDWNFMWKPMLDCYQKLLQEDVPQPSNLAVKARFNQLTEGRGRPLGFENFSKQATLNFKSTDWLNIRKLLSVIHRLSHIDSSEIDSNIRLSGLEYTLSQKIRRYVRDRKKYKFLDQNTQKTIPDNIKFCVYFLHYQPEYTADSLGRFYRNQAFLIANIAAALPGDHFLIVKEHPGMRGVRPISWYRDIMNHNIIVAHPDLSSTTLIKRAQLVFTIVGTAAIEAMFLGKPAVVFGKYAYANTHLIDFCSDFWQLNTLIRKKLETETPAINTQRYALCLLEAKYQASYPGLIPHPGADTNACIDDADNQTQIKHSFKQALTDLGIL